MAVRIGNKENVLYYNKSGRISTKNKAYDTAKKDKKFTFSDSERDNLLPEKLKSVKCNE